VLLPAREVHYRVVERHLVLSLGGAQVGPTGEGGRAREEGFVELVLGGVADPTEDESKTCGTPSDPSGEGPFMTWKYMRGAELLPVLPSRPSPSPSRRMKSSAKRCEL